jgi:hypothetical protein
MKFRIIFTAIALVLALPAAAQIRTVALAHEVTLTNLRLPQSEGGTIGFKPCEECEYQTERVSADTRWMLNGKSVSLSDFRVGLGRATKRDEVYVTILQHLEEDRITQVSVTLR